MTFAQVPAEQKAHSQKLVHHIQAVIEQNNGWIGFDEYMRLALYTKGLGYYAAGLPKFGEAGDFITAPEMGDLFGQCLAVQVEECLAHINGGSILEFGAGSGALAATQLNELNALSAMPNEYLIVELSAELRARQRATIQARAGEHLARVKWLDKLPTAFRGVVIANEVLDAMPVKVFEQDAQGSVFELGVVKANKPDTETETAFDWCRNKAGEQLESAVRHLDLNPRVGAYRSEMHFQAQAWLRSLYDCIESGVVLLIDYGFPAREYYHADRTEGTLMCHYRHHAHDNPFFAPGLQDMTSHIDFTAIADVADNAGFAIEGFASQGAFLLSLGLLDKLDSSDSVKAQLALAQQVKKLTMPHEMGELFKVLALSKKFDANLSGFAQQNNRHRL